MKLEDWAKEMEQESFQASSALSRAQRIVSFGVMTSFGLIAAVILTVDDFWYEQRRKRKKRV